MIEILFDHSYEDDYYYLSTITVNIKDPIEKERIERLLKECNLEGMIEYPDSLLRKRIAKFLKVDENLIDFDTNEIDT
ncbi:MULTISPECIES: hypothetical protein [Bacillota]|uniref:Uncharacterized protein n=1 Tax=Mesobacillus selenatarsenatis (strain DSM 18680 / JCM 14380 / FERM P-15431 / SF-1) TaxID=1321606 RepID=A0A0A8X2H0_MESS1|nr:hypothetical protein [Mesobacillus selenatarsenatis]GAM13414.1 hypothetical protein SAMD00020551_1558 [Mesobacillus selenatarsenatis SF-1]